MNSTPGKRNLPKLLGRLTRQKWTARPPVISASSDPRSSPQLSQSKGGSSSYPRTSRTGYAPTHSGKCLRREQTCRVTRRPRRVTARRRPAGHVEAFHSRDFRVTAGSSAITRIRASFARILVTADPWDSSHPTGRAAGRENMSSSCFRLRATRHGGPESPASTDEIEKRNGKG